jgi:LAS superfamily LD-carboxypeptidase LdcB
MVAAVVVVVVDLAVAVVKADTVEDARAANAKAMVAETDVKVEIVVVSEISLEEAVKKDHQVLVQVLADAKADMAAETEDVDLNRKQYILKSLRKFRRLFFFTPI